MVCKVFLSEIILGIFVSWPFTLRTRITGWPLGKTVRVKWKDGSLEGLVPERSVNADNLEGEWVSELLLERVV